VNTDKSNLRPKHFSTDIIWLSRMILSAFFVRFDSNGQEDPRCPERIEEMHDAIDTIREAIKQWFNQNEKNELYPLLDDLNESMNQLIELDRNANKIEVRAAMERFGILTQRMNEMTINIKEGRVG